jgi:Predicted membrane protein
MHETEQHNGILLYISTEDKKIGIWGDQGIHEKVGQHFWEEEIALIISHFKQGKKSRRLSPSIKSNWG